MNKTINEFPNYTITKEGIITNKKTGRVKQHYVGSTGYFMVTLSRENKQNPRRVHRLIAESYILNPDNKPHINHKDGDKLNNKIKNLEWVTHKENMQHAFKNGLANNTGEKNGMSKINSKIAKEVKNLKGKMSQQKIANKLGLTRSLVQGIHNGRLWKHIKA